MVATTSMHILLLHMGAGSPHIRPLFISGLYLRLLFRRCRSELTSTVPGDSSWRVGIGDRVINMIDTEGLVVSASPALRSTSLSPGSELNSKARPSDNAGSTLPRRHWRLASVVPALDGLPGSEGSWCSVGGKLPDPDKDIPADVQTEMPVCSLYH